MQALTSDDEAERVRLVDLLLRTNADTGYMHESFDVDDPSIFTRPWFGWADGLFAELLLDLTGRSTGRLHPRLPVTERPSPADRHATYGRLRPCPRPRSLRSRACAQTSWSPRTTRSRPNWCAAIWSARVTPSRSSTTAGPRSTRSGTRNPTCSSST